MGQCERQSGRAGDLGEQGDQKHQEHNHQEAQVLINMVEEESTLGIRPSGYNAMAGDVIAPSK
jgi:hypothetical protein